LTLWKGLCNLGADDRTKGSGGGKFSGGEKIRGVGADRSKRGEGKSSAERGRGVAVKKRQKTMIELKQKKREVPIGRLRGRKKTRWEKKELIPCADISFFGGGREIMAIAWPGVGGR